MPAGQTAVLTNADLHVSETGVAASGLTYAVLTGPAHGTLLKNGQPLGGATFTQADIVGGMLSYQCTATAPGSDSFTFTLSDGTHGTTATQAFAITIENQPGASVPTMPIILVGTT